MVWDQVPKEFFLKTFDLPVDLEYLVALPSVSNSRPIFKSARPLMWGGPGPGTQRRGLSAVTTLRWPISINQYFMVAPMDTRDGFMQYAQCTQYNVWCLCISSMTVLVSRLYDAGVGTPRLLTTSVTLKSTHFLNFLAKGTDSPLK